MVETFLESKLIHCANKDFICENNIYQYISFSKVYPEEESKIIDLSVINLSIIALLIIAKYWEKSKRLTED